MGMVFGICVIAFIGIILPIIATNLHRKGYYVNKEVRPYYDKIYSFVEPYLNTEFGKVILQKAEAILQDLYKTYLSFTKQSSLRDDDVCKLVVEKSQDSYFVELFSLLLVFSFRYNTPLRPSEEDRNALQALQSFARKKLTNLIGDIPECLFFYFETSSEQIRGRD